ncbi:hypothetical protein CROQUDRAFT_670614 [Cronartium quercuum f. sp. fusiforme G11]|uniref:Ubiquitin thioesterase OTU n=1 Tax=Cronartium quercuum f. sp. fusiforme G11 TaxID=708437 RepID=A0A9P6NJX6_9BASI|nr:hypothetical protein CROQUDRAFT_670614 [Cronartium quercuum f. sp. fusiforme G11]
MFKLRIRGPSGVATIEISPEASRKELYELVSARTDITLTKLELRLGFPRPQLLRDSDEDASVKSLGITNGETLQASIATGSGSTLPAQASLTSMAPTRSVPPSAPVSQSISSRPSKPQQVSVPVNDAHLVLRLVPDDNSCLFRAVGLCLEHGDHSSLDISSKLRRIVADAVRRDPGRWSEPVLGRKPDLYVSKITQKDVWGGAIELAILAEHYRTEICSIDVQTGRVDRFGESENFSQRIILIYSGIHYDAVTLSPIPPQPSSSFPPEIGFDTTIFSCEDDHLLSSASQLVRQLRDQHYYTDTASFTLRCTICSKALVGETDARKHAEQTGHTQFGEYA